MTAAVPKGASSSTARPEVAEAAVVLQGWIDRRQRAMVRNLHSCGQSVAQLHVLGLLRDLGGTTVSRIAAHLEISPPSASAIVDRMVDAELVARERSDADRRVVTVSLTTAGEEALQRAIGGRREMLESVLAQLTDAELRDTVRVITRLDAAINKVMPAPAADAEVA